jgi:large subunit ribosomal protein L24
MGTRVKKNDKVMIMSGKDRGKSGKVLFVNKLRTRLIVEGLNMVKKAKRPDQQNQKGGIIDIEAPLSISNVMVVCSKCGKPVRLKSRMLDNGKKVRSCGKCGEMLDKA